MKPCNIKVTGISDVTIYAKKCGSLGLVIKRKGETSVVWHHRALVLPGIPRNLVAEGMIPDSFLVIKHKGRMKVVTPNGRVVFTATKASDGLYLLDYHSIRDYSIPRGKMVHHNKFWSTESVDESHAHAFVATQSGDASDPVGTPEQWPELDVIKRILAENRAINALLRSGSKKSISDDQPVSGHERREVVPDEATQAQPIGGSASSAPETPPQPLSQSQIPEQSGVGPKCPDWNYEKFGHVPTELYTSKH